MRKTPQQTITFMIKLATLVGLVCSVVAAGYIYYVLGQAQIKLAELRFNKSNFSGTTAKLESGSQVREQDLKQYFAATQYELPYDKWLHGLIEKNIIELSADRLLILEDIELPAIFENSCKRFRCLQYKVNFEGIPSSLWKGLLGVEDFRFLEHKGVDLISIMRAIIVDLKAMKLVQGGSTLTQQLVKNLFLSNEKKFERKIREIIYAIYLEQELSKEEIITAYFNEVYWGTLQGIQLKGVGAASMGYFGKKPFELSEYEAAILIGMLKGPNYYHPVNHPQRLQKRTSIVFERLKKVNLLKNTEISWDAKKWTSWEAKLKSDHEKSNTKYLYSLYLLNNDQTEHWNSYEKFVFYQTVTKIKKLLGKRITGIDVAIKHLAISKHCNSSQCDQSFKFYTKIERDKNKAIYDEKHQVGSILKPIIYEQFLDMGKKLTDLVATTPITLNLKSGKWTPKDASKIDAKEITLLKALQKSKNIPVIRISQELGLNNLEKRLIDYFPTMLTPLAEYPAQLLGAIELDLGQVGDAYLKFVSQTCSKVQSGQYEFDQSILYYLSQADKTTISRVSSKLIQQMNMFGKTGTSNDGLDNWYVAFDGEQIYITWFGVDAQRAGKKMRLSGASSAYRVFQEFILYRGRRISDVFCF